MWLARLFETAGLVVLALLAAPGCSNSDPNASSGNDTSSGGHSGSGNHSTPSGGASVAIALSLTAPMSPAYTCTTTSSDNLSIGNPLTGETVANGTQDVDISCTVSAVTGGYKLIVDLAGKDYLFNIAGDTITDQTSPLDGPRLYFLDSKFWIAPTSTTCTFTPTTAPTPGAVTGKFDCPLLYNPDVMQSGCVASADIALRGCTQ